LTAEAGVDHAAADGHQDQEKGTQQLREQAPSLVTVVPEVELSGHRVRLAYGPQGNLGMTKCLLPFRLGWRGQPVRLAGHRAPHFRPQQYLGAPVPVHRST